MSQYMEELMEKYEYGEDGKLHAKNSVDADDKHTKHSESCAYMWMRVGVVALVSFTFSFGAYCYFWDRHLLAQPNMLSLLEVGMAASAPIALVSLFVFIVSMIILAFFIRRLDDARECEA